MSDRRRQRQQRVRYDAGGSQPSVGSTNREPEPDKPCVTRRPRTGGNTVAYAEPKQYESVSIMPDKEVAEPQKYSRHSVLSNWSRYEEIPTDEPEEFEDYMIGEDFSQILEQQVGGGGSHLQLKGESQWEDPEAGILTSHGLGALHIADLVAAINTLPLYTQLNLPEESLPVSVIDFYTQLAEDNRKLYKPSREYKDCFEINEKLLQSLKISDAEPLTLSNEEVETTTPSTKTAVDVALSLTEAFAPEPEDVDLNTLLREPSMDKDITPPRQPSPVKEQVSAKEPSPLKQVAREPSPLKQAAREPSPLKQAAREPSPLKQAASLKKSNKSSFDAADAQLSKVSESRTQDLPNGHDDQFKEKDPASFDFGLSKVNTSVNKKSNRKSKGKVSDPVIDSDPLKVKERVTEEVGGPSVDLDAPIEHSKPILINKSEEEDLEDWLDSVLDD